MAKAKRFPGGVVSWSREGRIKFRLSGGEYEYLVDGAWLCIRMRKKVLNLGRLMAEIKARAFQRRKNGGEWQGREISDAVVMAAQLGGVHGK